MSYLSIISFLQESLPHLSLEEIQQTIVSLQDKGILDEQLRLTDIGNEISFLLENSENFDYEE